MRTALASLLFVLATAIPISLSAQGLDDPSTSYVHTSVGIQDIGLGGRATVGARLTQTLSLEGYVQHHVHVQGHATVAGTGVRWFPWRSLNLGTGIGLRRFQEEGGSIFSDADFGTEHGLDLVVDVSLANRWTWDRFTLGVEWIGGSIGTVPLYTDVESRHGGSSGRRSRDTNNNALDVRLLNLQIGIVF